MSRLRFRRILTALLILVALFCQQTFALAGTTGGLAGFVLEPNGAPVANAKVTVSSPSQTSTTTTTAGGRYQFLSLNPDTYTVSVSKDGYQPTSQSGISVFADQQINVNISMVKSLRTIASVTSRAANDLVKPGTTSDVYSINAATADAIEAIGGGTNMDNAYSALATQPGVTLGYGGVGWGQTVYIHGSSYSQIGYEFDGIPVNRAFDNYNANTLTNLGQQELQVDTGGAPAGSVSETVGGFINQVIRTGTYPGFGNLSGGIGTPSYYHAAKGEAGGASPNRLFSYYAGVSGYNQSPRVYDEFFGGNSLPGILPNFTYSNTFLHTFNGVGAFPLCLPNGTDPNAALPLALDPGCAGGPYPSLLGQPFENIGLLSDREAVVNLHFGIPHRHDGGRDDIQILYNGSSLHSDFFDSLNDYGGVPFLVTQGLGLPATTPNPFGYTDSIAYPTNIAFGTPAAPTLAPLPYLFPASPTNRCANIPATVNGTPMPGSCGAGFAPIAPSVRDATINDAQIYKLQYQHNIGSTAYIRLYGYTFYSDWLNSSPVFISLVNNGIAIAAGALGAADYELQTHTVGGQLQFADQITPQHLLTLTANGTTATVNRVNNSSYANTVRTTTTNLTDAAGNCYDYGGATPGALDSCLLSTTSGTFNAPTRGLATNPCAAGQLPPGSPACLAGSQFIVTYTGIRGTQNRVKPVFSSYSLTDEWRPNDKILIDIGARLENFQYLLADSTTPDLRFWFNSAANSFCYDPATGQPLLTPVPPGSPVGTNPSPVITVTCPINPNDGVQTLHPNGKNGALLYSNFSDSQVRRTLLEPRVSGTYTFNPLNVFRFSVGRYANPFNTATVQYLDSAAKRASSFDFTNFWPFGFTTPEHSVQPATSWNADLSFEHQFKGTDVSMKLSPFYRYVTNQTQDFFIGPSFVSAIPTGNETAYGAELQFNKGDPNRNGFSGQLSFTWTRAFTKFRPLANGNTPVDTVNTYIDDFNALTAAGNRFGVKGAPCYDGSGTGAPAPAGACTVSNGTILITPAAQAAGVVVNPWFFKPTQSILNPGAPYPLYQSFPSPLFFAGFADQDMTIVWPYVFSGFLNYKHNKWAITPNFQMIYGYSGGSSGGGQYGSPLAIVGLDPRTCTANQGGGGTVLGSPAAPVPGMTGSGLPNYLSCSASLNNLGAFYVPNPYTGSFDFPGQYQNPWLLNLNVQVRYDFSPGVQANIVLANVYNRCFGGSKTVWSQAIPPGATVCGYWPNLQYVGINPGEGFFLGKTPTDPANGGALASKNFTYPYTGLASFLPFNAYFYLRVRL